MMIALRDFVFRHEIFVEAREFDDGLSSRDNPGPGRRESVRVATSRCSFAAATSESVSSVSRAELRNRSGHRSGSTFPRECYSGRRRLRWSTKRAVATPSVTRRASRETLRLDAHSLGMSDPSRACSCSFLATLSTRNSFCWYVGTAARRGRGPIDGRSRVDDVDDREHLAGLARSGGGRYGDGQGADDGDETWSTHGKYS
jgi:hypothetical protein